jgi:hypothetical protein
VAVEQRRAQARRVLGRQRLEAHVLALQGDRLRPALAHA